MRLDAQSPGEQDPVYSIISSRLRGAADHGWTIGGGSARDNGWIHVAYSNTPVSLQGWKLHISAGEQNALDVLERVLPVLAAEKVHFKAASLPLLSDLNEGNAGLSQVGKFITVYPKDDSQAVRLALTLHRATIGLSGPRVSSDKAVATPSIVHYRYGGFGDRHIQTAVGQILPSLVAPDGEEIPDRREARYWVPAWAADPFAAAGLGVDPPNLTAIVNRYITVSPLHEGALGTVWLAVDVNAERTCILKQVHSGTDGLAEALRNEYEALLRLSSDHRFPTPYDLVKDQGHEFLVMSDLEGESLESHVGSLTVEGRYVPTQQALVWAIELADALTFIHGKGVIHRDLKSANVIVGADGHLRLIDFGLAHLEDGKRPPQGRGTRGYASPQVSSGATSGETDDVYALGALLYCLLTGAEPYLAPDRNSLLARPIELLNPNAPESLIPIVGRCLAPEPDKRWASAQELGQALRHVAAKCSASHHGRSRIRPDSLDGRDPRFREWAKQLGHALCDAAIATEDGLIWRSVHEVPDGVCAYDLGIGCAGAVLALSELVLDFGDFRHRSMLLTGSRTLAGRCKHRPSNLPGLYVGLAGIGAALLRASQVLRDDELLANALSIGDRVGAMPHRSPDLFNGTAGRLRYHLMLWDECESDRQLEHAVNAGEVLLANMERVGTWRIPAGYDDLSGNAYLGYAHGAAGIADCLLDLNEVTRDRRYLDAAVRAGQWVRSLARPVLDDDSGFGWPSVEGEQTFGSFWCHGAAGIGRFFLHAAMLNSIEEAKEIARRCAEAVARAVRWANPTQCHGLAGCIEFLIDASRALGQNHLYSDALRLADLLATFARPTPNGLTWPSEAPETVTPDYMVGYAGVGVCLLRLGNPDRPHQLSRSGFRYK